MGLSAVSEEQAAANLAAEMPRFDFDGCRRAAAEKWKAALGRIALDEGTDPETRANFSAALYRAMLQPNDLGGAPQVPGATLALPGGRTLRIRVENFGAEGAFVRRVTLNGRELPDFKLRHADLLQGGELVFEMK